MPALPTQVRATATVGGVWTETYTLTQTPGGPPIDLTGLTFELVIRPSVTDNTSPPLVKVTSAGSTAQGSVVITPLAGTVFVTLTGTATTLLGQSSNAYTLWSNPADPSTAAPWVEGPFVTTLVAQP